MLTYKIVQTRGIKTWDVNKRHHLVFDNISYGEGSTIRYTNGYGVCQWEYVLTCINGQLRWVLQRSTVEKPSNRLDLCSDHFLINDTITVVGTGP